MRLRIDGEIDGLERGIGILGRELDFHLASDGLCINVEKAPGNIEVSLQGGKGIIKYNEKIHFFRALGLFIEAARQKNHFRIIEEPWFTLNGAMIDASRNAVLSVESIKKVLRIMAVMGLNMVMLYTEDTYNIDDMPYFGYMRGKYSYEELKECDDYADIFGIEMIPCIQTLAHLHSVLKWNFTKNIKDTGDVLLVGNEETYEFIEKMIKSASSPFRSKRIHIGMDEAYGLGLGRYLNINGYQNRFDIMNGHLAKVLEITSKYGLKPMIWSDMYFRLGSKTGDYYDRDADIPDQVVEKVPKDVQLVYWDYYHDDESDYLDFIRLHKKLGSGLVFAGGVWTWAGICVNYNKTFITTNASLSACKKEGIKEVFATMWGDDGAEANFFSALLGLQLMAEHGYTKELDADKLKRRFEFCTGGSYNAFMDLTYFDKTPVTVNESLEEPSNPSKYLLWQDLLTGLFDKHFEGFDMAGHYLDLHRKIDEHIKENEKWNLIFDMSHKLASVLSLKSDMGIKIKACYDKKDMAALKHIADVQLPELYRRIEELRITHRDQWFKTYKPFGWEVIDIRYGGLLSRVDSAIKRLTDYLECKVDRIEELEEEKLYYGAFKEPQGPVTGRCNRYHLIVTAGMLS